MDPVSAALPKNLQRIFVATLSQNELGIIHKTRSDQPSKNSTFIGYFNSCCFKHSLFVVMTIVFALSKIFKIIVILELFQPLIFTINCELASSETKQTVSAQSWRMYFSYPKHSVPLYCTVCNAMYNRVAAKIFEGLG